MPVFEFRPLSLCSDKSAGSVDQAGIGNGATLSNSGRPLGQRCCGSGWFAPCLAYLGSNLLGVLALAAVLGAGLASGESSSLVESGTGNGFALDGGEVGRAVVLGLPDEWFHDFCLDTAYLFLGASEYVGLLIVL